MNSPVNINSNTKVYCNFCNRYYYKNNYFKHLNSIKHHTNVVKKEGRTILFNNNQ